MSYSRPFQLVNIALFVALFGYDNVALIFEPPQTPYNGATG